MPGCQLKAFLVIARGIKIVSEMNDYKFEVKRSRIHGRGLFARSRIPARRKVGELGGEAISQAEARRRAKRAHSIKIVELGDGTAIDASVGGNHFKYVNHSCSPNAYMRIAYGRLEFYSLREIRPGEELTCNYGETHHEGALTCRCHSPQCQGYI
jgi:SET domain-containing protein